MSTIKNSKSKKLIYWPMMIPDDVYLANNFYCVHRYHLSAGHSPTTPAKTNSRTTRNPQMRERMSLEVRVWHIERVSP